MSIRSDSDLAREEGHVANQRNGKSTTGVTSLATRIGRRAVGTMATSASDWGGEIGRTNSMRNFITGASGYIGAEIARALESEDLILAMYRSGMSDVALHVSVQQPFE